MGVLGVRLVQMDGDSHRGCHDTQLLNDCGCPEHHAPVAASLDIDIQDLCNIKCSNQVAASSARAERLGIGRRCLSRHGKTTGWGGSYKVLKECLIGVVVWVRLFCIKNLLKSNESQQVLHRPLSHAGCKEAGAGIDLPSSTVQ